jgi:hypothetical protein
MSTTAIDRQVVQVVQTGHPGPRRVRQQAREAVTLMAFSAVTSVALAAVLLLLTNVPQLG